MIARVEHLKIEREKDKVKTSFISTVGSGLVASFAWLFALMHLIIFIIVEIIKKSGENRRGVGATPAKLYFHRLVRGARREKP